jgi:hypothetical protein
MQIVLVKLIVEHSVDLHFVFDFLQCVDIWGKYEMLHVVNCRM